MIRTVRAPWLIVASALVLCQTAQADHIQPGFNLFSVEQDIEVGRQSAAEAERQLPLLRDASVDRYLNDLIQSLARNAPGARYPYTIRAVNSNEINAMSLPGGPMYVNRGLIQAARNEAELVGVLSHEMAHVALRHGTHQASKAYLGQAGIGILGGLLGRGGGNAGRIINAVGGLGLNAVFLKFSRDAEYQADAVGAEIMAKSGYSPLAMASFFELLRSQQKRNPSALANFFASHPPAADREARIRQQAQSLQVAQSRDTGGFQSVKGSLGGMARAGSQRTPVREVPRGGYGRGSDNTTSRADIRIDPPSTRFARFDQRGGFFSIDHPDNWQAYQSAQGFGVTLAPRGGVIDMGDGNQAILEGVIINHYDPFESGYGQDISLAQATDDVARQITQSNSYLRVAGAKRREQIDQAPGYSMAFAGTSPTTGQQERVALITREMGDGHVLYVVLIAPGSQYDSVDPIFRRMVQSLRVDDEAAHRTPTN